MCEKKEIDFLSQAKDNYRLFLIVALSAICLIYIYDMGAISLSSESRNDLILKFPFLEKSDILINIVSFFYNLNKDLFSLIFVFLASVLFITGSFMIVIIFSSLVTQILSNYVNKIAMNVILFCMLNAYIIYYPLHVVSQGCALPILFPEFMRIISIFLLLGVLLVIFSIIVGIYNYIKKFKKD